MFPIVITPVEERLCKIGSTAGRVPQIISVAGGLSVRQVLANAHNDERFPDVFKDVVHGGGK